MLGDCQLYFERAPDSAPFMMVDKLLWLGATDASALFEHNPNAPQPMLAGAVPDSA